MIRCAMTGPTPMICWSSSAEAVLTLIVPLVIFELREREREGANPAGDRPK